MDDCTIHRCCNCNLKMQDETEKHPVLLGNYDSEEESAFNITISRAFQYLFGIEQIAEKFLCEACVSVLTFLYFSKRNLLRNSQVSSLLFKMINRHESVSPTGENSVILLDSIKGDVSINPEVDNIETVLSHKEYKVDRVQKQHSGKSNSEEFRELFIIVKINQLKYNEEAIFLLSKTHFTCQICNRKFSEEKLLENHHESVHSIEVMKYDCSLCPKKFFCEWFLKNHIGFAHNGVTIEFKFKCDNCNYAIFSSEVELKRHELEVHDLNSINCDPIKNDVVSKMKNPESHPIKSTVGKDEHNKPTSSTRIDATQVENGNCGSQLFLDDKSVLQGETFKCPKCGKSFGLKWSLHIHLKTHSSERLYACEHCTRTFSNSVDLRRHLVTHSEERPFKCLICGSAFYKGGHLIRHLKTIHTQAKEDADVKIKIAK